jgi:hypothetical protein
MPLWLLGLHHPLHCVLQVVCDSNELEIMKELWIELLGVLFSVSLDCYNNSSYF